MTHGETRSKSILEKQQMRPRISSVLFVVSKGEKVIIRTHEDFSRTHESEVHPQ